jgi:hypothetical protein
MAARKFNRARLDQLVEAAKASEHPYAALEGKPFNLSASIARTLVVGSGLSKSADEVREREKARIAKWLEAGAIGGKPKAAPKPKAEQTPESAPDAEAAADGAIKIPEAAASAIDKAYEKARVAHKARKGDPRKDGEASDTAKAIAANRDPVASA